MAASVLSPYYKRAAQTLFSNVMRLAEQSKGIGYLAFITLTFSEDIRNHKEASRRLNSWNSNWFSSNPDYANYINTKELQEQRKVWHYHIIVQVSQDIRQDFDFAAFREWLKGNNRFKRPCPTGSPYFHKLWSELNEAAQRYGFGKITSIEPIETTEEAVSRYIGGYIGKTIGRRTDQEKGVRLVNYPKGWTRNSPKFSWNTANAAQWRKKVSEFAKLHGCQEFYQLSDKLGPNWAYRYLEDIINVYEIKAEQMFQYRLQDDQKTDKETGETISIAYQDRIFSRIHRNDQTKTQLLHAEVLEKISPKQTYKHWQKNQRKKEESRNEIQMMKWRYSEQMKAYQKGQKQPQPTKEETEKRRQLSGERAKNREKEREKEKHNLKHFITNYPENLIGILPDAPF